MRKFRFGTRSLGNLYGVEPRLVLLCGIALWASRQDFGVFEGARTEKTQKEYIKRGVSWTMDSAHLPQKDGYAWAVDLVPWVGGAYRWDSITAFQEIGKRMRAAADAHGINLIWGAHRKYGGDWKKRNDMAHFELKRD